MKPSMTLPTPQAESFVEAMGVSKDRADELQKEINTIRKKLLKNGEGSMAVLVKEIYNHCTTPNEAALAIFMTGVTYAGYRTDKAAAIFQAIIKD